MSSYQEVLQQAQSLTPQDILTLQLLKNVETRHGTSLHWAFLHSYNLLNPLNPILNLLIQLTQLLQITLACLPITPSIYFQQS